MKIFLMATLLVSVFASAATHRVFADGQGSGPDAPSVYQNATDEAYQGMLNRCRTLHEPTESQPLPGLEDIEWTPREVADDSETAIAKACKNISHSDTPFYICIVRVEARCVYNPKGTQ